MCRCSNTKYAQETMDDRILAIISNTTAAAEPHYLQTCDWVLKVKRTKKLVKMNLVQRIWLFRKRKCCKSRTACIHQNWTLTTRKLYQWLTLKWGKLYLLCCLQARKWEIQPNHIHCKQEAEFGGTLDAHHGKSKGHCITWWINLPQII